MNDKFYIKCPQKGVKSDVMTAKYCLPQSATTYGSTLLKREYGYILLQ